MVSHPKLLHVAQHMKRIYYYDLDLYNVRPSVKHDQEVTSYILLKSMNAMLILINVRAISLRAVEPVDNCFRIPLRQQSKSVVDYTMQGLLIC